jgi:hypothetical protein
MQSGDPDHRRRSDVMFARVGIMKALNRRVERVFNPIEGEIH